MTNAVARRTASRVHPLLDGLVDYAGLFPPAALDMGAAVDDYVRQLDGRDAPMLARFICPAARLEELIPFANRFDSEHVLRLAVLADPARAWSGEPDPLGVANALATTRAFLDRFAGASRVEVVETRLSGDMLASGPAAIETVLSEAADSSDVIPLFVELPLAALAGPSVEALERFQAVRARGREALGVKIRCGGDGPDAYPTPHDLAVMLRACLVGGIPFKATAGLHHPVRAFHATEGVVMHGFLNVFGAAVLGATLDLSASDLEIILAEQDEAAFSLSDNRFSFRSWTAPVPAVRAVRAGLARSFGSCSFDEPADELRALGWSPSGDDSFSG